MRKLGEFNPAPIEPTGVSISSPFTVLKSVTVPFFGLSSVLNLTVFL